MAVTRPSCPCEDARKELQVGVRGVWCVHVVCSARVFCMRSHCALQAFRSAVARVPEDAFMHNNTCVVTHSLPTVCVCVHAYVIGVNCVCRNFVRSPTPCWRARYSTERCAEGGDNRRDPAISLKGVAGHFTNTDVVCSPRGWCPVKAPRQPLPP